MSNSSAMAFELSMGIILISVVLLYMTFATKEDSSKRMVVAGEIDINANLLASNE